MEAVSPNQHRTVISTRPITNNHRIYSGQHSEERVEATIVPESETYSSYPGRTDWATNHKELKKRRVI